MTPSSVSVPLLSPQRFLPPAEPKEFPATSDRVLSFHILDSLAPAPERQVQPIIRGESHTGDILSKVYQILWTGTAAGGNIFCNVASHILPSHCRTALNGEAAGRETDLQLDGPCWRRPGRAFVWLLTLTSAPVKTIYCTYRGQESASNARKQQYGWYSQGLGPRGAQFGRSESGGSFPSFGTICQTRVHESIAVTPRDESLALLWGGIADMWNMSHGISAGPHWAVLHIGIANEMEIPLQCPPDFTPRKRSHRHKKAAVVSLWKHEGRRR